MLLNPLNSTMIAVALSKLQVEFQLSFADLSWVISIYYLASCVAHPIMGRFSDQFGRKKLFIVGSLITALSSFMAAFSPSFIYLLICRVFQAIGSSALFPAGIGMVRNTISENQTKALGLLSIFSSGSASLGPTIGGLLVTCWDWRGIFLFNVPITILGIILAVLLLPKEQITTGKKPKIDWIGIGLFTGLIISCLMFFYSIETQPNWYYLVMGLILTILYYLFEKKLAILLLIYPVYRKI